ncbi:putative DnaJ domain protein [Eremomyces bilateralis CBS 781.70]|uniref:DnaJ domain protein n=1 Tax=Eremomyces bilateralis CBS 781.70 TaxID=1392243 RepID=A0A6G1FTG1_9PEZI|nr:putative DnaJ domain protein [Eremomyces bilateralis CBS 781.70]KAF1809043.1 putative DnaJ domain protein [Eremomyces bilateralis CBS 781.70]
MLFWSSLLVLFILPSIALCAEDFYKLLGLDRDASDREIKKAYRTLSKKFHPDKNPNNEDSHTKFVSIAEAYEVLIEPQTRKIYDQYGHEGLAQHQQGGGGHQGHHDPFDLFSRFFGGSGHFGHHGGERRGPTMEAQIDVPLRDFYMGKEMQFTIEKQAICSSCEGTGSDDGVVDECSVCSGRGHRVQRHMLAPGIFQQVQSVCDACGGKGKTVHNPCTVCHGARVVREPETHTLDIEKGMPRGVRVTFENEGDESPDWVAGDLIVNVQELDPSLGEEDHEKTDGTFFRRRGNDLFWTEVLSLREAWMGSWQRNITHLDGHIVQLSRPRGKVVQPNAVEVISGEGMPIWNNDRSNDSGDEEYGALNVEYVVILPDTMASGMEKDFWNMWEKWRKKLAVNLWDDSGRSKAAPIHNEL